VLRSRLIVTLRYCCFATIMLSASLASLHGEEVSLAGKVTDASGAIISGAQIELRLQRCSCKDCPNPEKCDCCIDQLRADSNDSGVFRISARPGDYELTVKAPGFRVARQQVKLETKHSSRVDVKLE